MREMVELIDKDHKSAIINIFYMLKDVNNTSVKRKIEFLDMKI